MAEDHAHPEEDIPESQPVDFCTSLSVSIQRRGHCRRHGAASPANLETTLLGGSNAVLRYAGTKAYTGCPAQICQSFPNFPLESGKELKRGASIDSKAPPGRNKFCLKNKQKGARAVKASQYAVSGQVSLSKSAPHTLPAP